MPGETRLCDRPASNELGRLMYAQLSGGRGEQKKLFVFDVLFAHDNYRIKLNPKRDREGQWWLPLKT